MAQERLEACKGDRMVPFFLLDTVGTRHKQLSCSKQVARCVHDVALARSRADAFPYMSLMASHLLSAGVLASAGHVETVTSRSSSSGSVFATAGASSSESHMSLFSGSSSSTSGARCALSEKSVPSVCMLAARSAKAWKAVLLST